MPNLDEESEEKTKKAMDRLSAAVQDYVAEFGEEPSFCFVSTSTMSEFARNVEAEIVRQAFIKRNEKQQKGRHQ